MSDDRRSFIKRFGATLGSLIVSGLLPGCGPKKDAGVSGTESQIKGQADASPIPRGPEWEALRQCWLNLKDERNRHTLVEEFLEALRQEKDPFAVRKDALAEDHQAILDTLVERGQLEAPIAEYMQAAFEEAAYHVIRSKATCYMGLPIEYAPRKDLLMQADVLCKISGDLDPGTVAKAQAAVAQDMAFFEVFKAGRGPYDWSLADNYKAGNLKASPEVLEAARLLTQLFVGTSD